MPEPASYIIWLIRAHRLRFGTEAQLHDDLAQLFFENGVKFDRELRLSEQDRIDFYLPEYQIGVECKVEGGPTPVAAQLLRYAQHERIAQLILVTSRKSQLLTVDQLAGKTCHCLWIGGSGL